MWMPELSNIDDSAIGSSKVKIWKPAGKIIVDRTNKDSLTKILAEVVESAPTEEVEVKERWAAERPNWNSWT